MFNPFMARCVWRVRAEIGPRELLQSVVEFGNQRYGARGVIPGTKAVYTTKEFYQALGFSRYLALDVNTDMDAVVVDLNEPLRLNLSHDPDGEDMDHIKAVRLGQWDLVTNNGTGEHIFDQAAVFKNAHDLCVVGGVMLHVLPFSPWINHGFYNFQPILFRDLTAANGYELLFVCIGDRNESKPQFFKASDDWLFVEKNPYQLINYMAEKRVRTADLLIGVAMRKTVNEPFRKPLQGKYQSAVQSDGLREKYKPK